MIPYFRVGQNNRTNTNKENLDLFYIQIFLHDLQKWSHKRHQLLSRNKNPFLDTVLNWLYVGGGGGRGS